MTHLGINWKIHFASSSQRNLLIQVGVIALIACLLSFNIVEGQEKRSNPNQLPDVKAATLGSTKNVHVCGNLFTAGQFGQKDISKIKEAGISKVISLRTKPEVKWDEKGELESVGISFQNIPFYFPNSLSDEIFDKVRTTLKEKNNGKTLLHCGSAVRVAAVWLPYRVLDQGQSFDTALAEAKTIGRLPKGYEDKARSYIKRMLQEKQKQSERADVPKGINKSFLDPNLNVDQYVKRFEVESREIFTSRNETLKACNIPKDAIVADVGAGTGLFTRLFSIQASSGWVYAVDISPKFLEHIRSDCKKFQMTNVSPLLCQEDSVNLPPNSVDIVFICDTYHHFEFPQRTLKSIQNALRPGGSLVLIDFERIEGVTKPWLMKHVRAGKGVFRSEIEKAGFKFEEEKKVPGLKENYFLRFKSPKVQK